MGTIISQYFCVHCPISCGVTTCKSFDLHTEFWLWIDGQVMRHQKIFQLMMMKDLDSGDLEQAPLGIDIIQFPITILQKKGKLSTSEWIHVRICRDDFYFFSSRRHEKNKASTQDMLLALTGCKFERKTIYGEFHKGSVRRNESFWDNYRPSVHIEIRTKSSTFRAKKQLVDFGPKMHFEN